MGFLDGLMKRFRPVRGPDDEPEGDQLRQVMAEPAIKLGGAKLQPACDRLPGCSGRFGHDPTNPIPVNGLMGTFAYLNTLRARSGVGVFFHRLRSLEVPILPYPLDIYEVVAADASQWATLYFSIYFPRRSSEAPEGFERRGWSTLSQEVRAMVRLPAMGSNQPVPNFPLGLPEVVRASPYLRGVSPGLSQSMARSVERLLMAKQGQWSRPGDSPVRPEADNLMTDEEIHQFGVQVVAEHEAKSGATIVSVQAELGKEPQIVARIDGRLAFIAVRTACYPGKGTLEPSGRLRLKALAAEVGATPYFAQVGIANSTGKNDLEMAIPVRGAGFYVAYEGLEQLP